MLKKQILFCLLLTIEIYATPDTSTLTIELLLGSIGNNYVIHEYIFENEGIYYQYSETYFLVIKDKNSNQIIEKQLLKKQDIELTHNTSSFERQVTITEKNENILLTPSDLEIIYKAHSFNLQNIEIQESKILVHYNLRDSEGKRTVEIGFPSDGTIDEESRVNQVYQDYDSYYFEIEYGSPPRSIKYFVIRKEEYEKLCPPPE